MRVTPVIQCNHVDFEGALDASLRRDDEGCFAIEKVIEGAKALSGATVPVIACPDVPDNEIFVELAAKHGIHCHLGSRSDVAGRLLEAAAREGGTHIAWLQGLLYFLDVPLMERLIGFGLTGGYDYARCVDGTCKHWLGQFVSVDSLQRLISMVDEEFRREEAQWHRARPFAFMRRNADRFRVGLFEDLPVYSDEWLSNMRARAKRLHTSGERAQHTVLGTSVGDVSVGRYKEILELIPPNQDVLDVACGTGYGSQLLTSRGNRVVGVDISDDAISEALGKFPEVAAFRVGEGTSIPVEDRGMDMVVSIATIEHIPDDAAFVREISRVLRPSGRCIVYTPQNRLGKIPTWPWHEREYSIEWLASLFEDDFVVDAIWGWQNGMVTKDDPRGDGTYLICTKKG